MKRNTLYPSFLERVVAYILDNLILSILSLPLLHMFVENYDQVVQNISVFLQTGQPFELDIPYFVINLGLPFVVTVLLWIKFGATPGKMLFKMKIVDEKTNQPPKTIQLVIRYLGYIVSAFPLGLGFLWILIDPKNRAFHDILAGTVVIRAQSGLSPSEINDQLNQPKNNNTFEA